MDYTNKGKRVRLLAKVIGYGGNIPKGQEGTVMGEGENGLGSHIIYVHWGEAIGIAPVFPRDIEYLNVQSISGEKTQERIQQLDDRWGGVLKRLAES